jgi:hypothetical protein
MPNTLVTRSSGLNASEQHLARLAERTFLNLWSYPNPHKEPGKEICDLLVVCGDHVLIFSCKSIDWRQGDDVGLAWSRWYRHAIADAARQIKGAERWLARYPEKVFVDSRCEQPLPIPLPPLETRKVHGIVVALGAGQACRDHFGEGSGSLMLIPGTKDADHVDADARPFVVGDIDSSGPFVHVLDDATLTIVLEELDTVRDLTDYLSAKERIFRSGLLTSAAGEEELVAYYVTHVNGLGRHDFTRPDGSDWDVNEHMALIGGYHADLVVNPQYVAKKAADRASYWWDRLIENFTGPMLVGTNFVPPGFPNSVSDTERAMREMALTRRLERRPLGEGVMRALTNGRDHWRFATAILPGPTEESQEKGFLYMTLARPDPPLPGGYQDYRDLRVHMLRIYADALLHKHRNLKWVVGIASEPPGAGGSSEDLIMVERPPVWTDEIVAELQEDKKLFNIMAEGRYDEKRFHGDEYPQLASPAKSKRPPQTGNPCKSPRRRS